MMRDMRSFNDDHLCLQVKYKEEYEKNRGKTQMEFVDTQMYKMSKEAQKMQSEKEYRKEYESQMKGKVLLEVDLTPAYLTARNASSLISEKEYRKDLEQEVKGKGLTGLEETPDLLRVKNAGHILSEKEYRKDLEQEVKGKGLTSLEETPDLLRLHHDVFVLLQKEYRKDLECEIRGKGTDVTADSLDMQRAKKASEISSDVSYRQASQNRESSYGTVTDTPALLHAAYLKDVYSQLFYTWDSRLMKGLTSAVVDTPEIRLARENAKNISDVQYRESVGTGTAVTDTPEMERVRRNQNNISDVKYKKAVDPVQYQRGLQEVKGHSCSELDTPEMRRVRKSQESVSMAKYHEEFERSRGRGATHTLDEQHMARLHGDQLMGAGDGYHGIQPQVVEMDRRSAGAAGVYQHHSHHPQQYQQGYAHMQAVRSVQSPPHSASMQRVYRALYDYAAQDHDEVSFRDGDVIVNAQPIDEGWMFGTVQRTGKSGMLPANYVECLN
ncbi:nebulette isoform X2 [Labeo rohita]|uniref:Nebulette isoform X2 n=1 Tax=Labeo rohita TaxID=84645 RepID=A0A498M216_LABRO|nr:nebulette isoform X2 [Labeo rohita]